MKTSKNNTTQEDEEVPVCQYTCDDADFDAELVNVSASPLVGRPGLPERIHLRAPKPPKPPILTLGRLLGCVDFWIDSPARPKLVSRRHAEFTYSAKTDTWWVSDLKSVNGVFVNNIRVDRTSLREGDIIAFDVGGGSIRFGDTKKPSQRNLCVYRFHLRSNTTTPSKGAKGNGAMPKPKEATTPSSKTPTSKRPRTETPPTSGTADQRTQREQEDSPALKRAKLDVGTPRKVSSPVAKESTTTSTSAEPSKQDDDAALNDEDEDPVNWVLKRGTIVSCLPEPESGDLFWIAEVVKDKKKGQKTVYVRWFEHDPRKRPLHYVRGGEQRLNVATLTSRDVSDLVTQVAANLWKVRDHRRLYAADAEGDGNQEAKSSTRREDQEASH